MIKLDEYLIEIEGLKYKYYDNQVGEKIIIFIHGLGSNKEPMSRFFENYLQNFRCIFLDLPSHNKIPSYEFNKLEDFANYVLKFVKYLGIKDFSLIGFSFGGLVAIQTSKELAKIGVYKKTVAWASPLEKSFLSLRSNQFLKVFDWISNKEYQKLPKSKFFRFLAALWGIKMKSKDVDSFTYFENTRLDKFHLMMPEKQLDTKDLNILYVFGTSDPLINSKGFTNTKVNNQNQHKILIDKGGHYLTSSGHKEALKEIFEFLEN